MLGALSFLKQSAAGGIFTFWSYVVGTLILEAICWGHFYFEAMLRAPSFLKQSAGGIFTLKLCWGHSLSWKLGAFLLWSYVEGTFVLEAVCWGHFYFEAMLRALSFLKQSAGGIFTFWSYVEGTPVLEAVCWRHFYSEAMLRAFSFLKQSAGAFLLSKAMLRALSFSKQSAGGIFYFLKLCWRRPPIFTLKLCWGHSCSWSSLLGAFLLWSYVEGILVLEAICWGHFYFEAMLRALSFLKQSAGGIFTLKLCWGHSHSWSNLLLGAFLLSEAMLWALSFLKQSAAGGISTLKLCWGRPRSWSSLLGAFLLWNYVEGTLVLEEVCWGHFYFEAMLKTLSFLKQSAGGIFTLKLCWGHSRSWSSLLGTFLLWSYVEGTLVLEAVCWGHFYLWSYVEGTLVLEAVCWGHFYFLKLCWGHSPSWSSLLVAFLVWSYVEGTLVLEAVCWGHFFFEAMLRALSFLKQSAGGIFTLKLCWDEW